MLPHLPRLAAAALLCLAATGCITVRVAEVPDPDAPAANTSKGAHASASPAATRQPVIALLTDYGTRDEYVGVLKGVMLSANPDARIIDITHEVDSFGIREGDYLLASAAEEFPAGTVFVAVVDPGVGTARRPIAIKLQNGMWFVGPDNGIFTGVLERWPLAETWEILRSPTGRVTSATFQGRDLFGPTGALLARGESLAEFARRSDTPPVLLPRVAHASDGNELTGEIVHADKYGNLILNIPADTAQRLGWTFGRGTSGTPVLVGLGRAQIVARCAATYGEVPIGDPVLVVNSRGTLEIAINQGSAAERYGVRAGERIAIARQEPTSAPQPVPAAPSSPTPIQP